MVSSAGWRWSGPGRPASSSGWRGWPRWPVLRLRALDPSHPRDAQRAQLAEQARAPALAVEDQRQAWCASACQQAQLAQLRHHPVPDLRHHAGVYLAVQAQQRRPAQRVHPVADRGRQGQLLAGHEMFRQPALTAVDLHVAIDEQRGDGLRIVCTPVLGQAADPGRQPLGSGQLARAAAQGARAGAAVQAQQGAPLAGLLVAQPLGATHPPQQQEGPQQQQRLQAVEALGQRQLVEVAQQADLQQARQGGQHAAPADGRGGGEARGGGVTPVAVFLAGGRRAAGPLPERHCHARRARRRGAVAGTGWPVASPVGCSATASIARRPVAGPRGTG